MSLEVQAEDLARQAARDLVDRLVLSLGQAVSSQGGLEVFSPGVKRKYSGTFKTS